MIKDNQIIGGLLSWHTEKRHSQGNTEVKRSIIQQLLQEYNIESANNIQDALKDLLNILVQ